MRSASPWPHSPRRGERNATQRVAGRRVARIDIRGHRRRPAAGRAGSLGCGPGGGDQLRDADRQQGRVARLGSRGTRASRASPRARAGRRPTGAGSGRRCRRRAARRSAARPGRSRCRDRSAAPGWAGSATSSSAMRPPGRTTRASSAKMAVRSVKFRRANPQVAPSTDASDRGSAAPSACSRANGRGAAASMPKLRSAPIGNRPRSSRSAARSPVPQARSSTEQPGGRPSAETVRRRQPTSMRKVITRLTRS